MKRATMRPDTDTRRPRLRWTVWAFILTCLASGVYMASCSGQQNPGPEQRSSTTPSALSGGVVADQLEFSAASGSRAELQGTTTVGAWTSKSTDIHGQVILSADEKKLDALFDRIQTASPMDHGDIETLQLSLPIRSAPVGDIIVPVTSLHGDSTAMDHDMHAALKASLHPVIKYVFQRVEHATVQRGPQDHQASLKLNVLGKLDMAGAARPIVMDVVVKRDSPGHFTAYAQTTMLMTDFGVTPPVALFGLIKADDHVHVVFDLDLILAGTFAKRS